MRSDVVTVRGYWSGPVVLVNMPRGGQKAFRIDKDSPDVKVPVFAYFQDDGNVSLITCGSGEELNIVGYEDYPVDYGSL